MFNRSSIFALAAVSTLVAAALVPTNASAMRGGFGGGFGGGHSFGGGGFAHTSSFARTTSFARTGSFGHVSTGFGHVSTGFGHVATGFGHRGFGHTPTTTGHCGTHCGPNNPGNPPGKPCHINCGPGFPPVVWWHHHHHPHWGFVGESVPVALEGVAGDTTVAASAPCTCLTKKYLDDGSVLFTDICTKEEALATPDELKAQAQGPQGQTQTR